jgi:hypothetical protein
MKKLVVFSAFAVFALGAVVGRASVSAPVAPPTVAEAFSPSSLAVSPNLPIENYTAI